MTLRKSFWPCSKDGREGEEAPVGDFVVAGEAPVDDPIEKSRNIRIELEQENDGRLSQSINLRNNNKPV